MHIKQNPADFRVEERIAVQPGGRGDFALYRLEKKDWTTHDAVRAVCRRWRIDARRVSVAGLKDRHAHTLQHVTILRGPQRKLTQQSLALTYLGQLAEPLRSEHIVANRFEIVLRDATKQQTEAALAALEEVRQFGVPNYFDDQRFGSVADGGPFMARALALDDAETALKLALTAPYRFDRAASKRDKALLRKHWGDWPQLAQQLPHGPATAPLQSLLVHPGDFIGAVLRLHPDLRGLYLSAYQSHLWNRMLALWIEAHLPADQLVPVRLRTGVVPMHRRLTIEEQTQLADLQLPLHSPRAPLEANDPRKPYFDQVLKLESITLEQMRLKGLRGLFFSKGERRALIVPANVVAEPSEDELRAGRQKLKLDFELPRGAYATLIVKRISV